MKINIDVDGRVCVPLATLPYITDGFLTGRRVVQILASPGSFVSDGGTALDAFEFLPYGVSTYVSDEKISTIAETCFWEPREPPLRSIAGIVVPEIETRELMGRLYQTGAFVQQGQGLSAPPSWNPDAALPVEVVLAVVKALPVTLRLSRVRKNSRQAALEKTKRAIDRIDDIAAENGVPFDRTNIQGWKRDFIRILKKIDPSIAASFATFDSYFEELGLRWRQGSQPADAVSLMTLQTYATIHAVEFVHAQPHIEMDMT